MKKEGIGGFFFFFLCSDEPGRLGHFPVVIFPAYSHPSCPLPYFLFFFFVNGKGEEGRVGFKV